MLLNRIGAEFDAISCEILLFAKKNAIKMFSYGHKYNFTKLRSVA